jgi:putative peptidoglycan lipid II flippase
VALSTVILPNLSRKFARQDPHAFSATLDWSLRLALIITLPAAVGLAMLSKPILITLFQYEAFLLNDVEMASLSLSAYAIGLPAFIAVKVLAPGFYARQDTRTPVKIAIIAMFSNMAMNLIFVGVFLALALKGPHTGLALASSVAAYLNAGLLYRGLRRQRAYLPERGWGRVCLAVLAGCVAMAALIWWQVGELSHWIEASAIPRAVKLSELILLGLVVYFIGLLAGGMRKHLLEKGAS